MDNNTKIQILKNRIEILENENRKLKEENERLNDQLYLSRNIHKDSVDTTNKLFELLRNKEKEFDGLIMECKSVKEEYAKVSNEMQELMRKYKKDINSASMRQLFDKIRFRLG